MTDHDGYETLGQTLDDAAGEAFDKGARLLGLGYPGGPALSKLAAEGDPAAFKFPIARDASPGSTSRSPGLKTALLYKVRDLGPEETARRAADLAASYEHAIVEALMLRVERALDGRGRAAPGDRRRRRRQPPAARARRRRSASRSTSRRPSCAPTTRR